MNSIQHAAALRIVRRIENAGHEAVFAGGCVRDMLLGLGETADIDIATDAMPQKIASLFPRVAGVGEHFGVMLVIEQGIPFEVATYRRDIGELDGRHPRDVQFCSAQHDAQRRDFTINGLFYDPLRKKIIDYVDGRQDIERGIVRAIGNPELRFREDYLRMLRAIRFATRFDFKIEQKTWTALKRNAAGIKYIAHERIFQELNRMLLGPHPDIAIRRLSDAGLCGLILPEVEALKGVQQPSQFHPEGDVYAHTLMTLSHLTSPSPVGAWAALLHDIGKPATMTRRDRIRFNNHHRIGARLARRALQRLKASRALMDSVYQVVDRHMDFMNVKKMRLSTLKRFLASPTFNDELELHRADCLASHGDLENYTFLKQKQEEFADEGVRPQPLLRGQDLIALGMKPGPQFGAILREAYDLQLEETFRTKSDAVNWVRRAYQA